jgi:acyl-coenzyme A synthetase/AMP-(fatty) acid ligase
MLLSRPCGTTAFVTDDMVRLSVSRLACGCASAQLISSLRGKTVALATSRQIETLAALIQLDGVARRIVLWPQDRPATQIDDVAAEAEIDHIATAWTLTCECDCDTQGPAQAREAVLDTQYVLFTSGTTSRPKMVLHSLASLSGHLWAGAQHAGRAAPRVWCTFYDIRRYGGLQVALRALFGGCSLVLSGPADEKPAAFLARAGRAQTSHILGTPSHWRRALMSDAAGLIAPNYVRLSGEVADQVILDQLAIQYPEADIVHAFASTEAGLAFEIADRRAGFPAGTAAVGGQAALAVKDGTLRVRSPRNALGYLGTATSALADDEGYVDTGDVVVLQRGRYYFAGRRDGTINVGGQKVHPEEVEAVINLHPQVQMSLVAGRRNPITGAVIMARVVARANAAPTSRFRLEQEVRDLCRQHLPAHKVPASVSLVRHLDVSPAGKLIRAGA